MSGDEKSVWGDKAYPTEKHKRAARFLGIYFGILDKAKRGQTLSNKQHKRNKQKSAVRVPQLRDRASFCFYQNQTPIHFGLGK